MTTYDEPAFERFCSDLVADGFSPVSGTDRREWVGPIRPSLQALTEQTRMKVEFYPGWPLRYAHVFVRGMRAEHASQGLVCLWAEDDPAQISARELSGLWGRIDEWAEAALRGFSVSDRALDAYYLYDEVGSFRAELPFLDLVQRGNNGFVADLRAVVSATGLVSIESEGHEFGERVTLTGLFLLRNHLDPIPTDLEAVLSSLTSRQRATVERALNDRGAFGVGERSGGLDFLVLAWPRHEREHDALVIMFAGAGNSIQSVAMPATANDVRSRRRRAGGDADALSDKNVLMVGAGSVGGNVALGLASSGVGRLTVCDSDVLSTGNLVRHVNGAHLVGYPKVQGLKLTIGDHAPWTEVTWLPDVPLDPELLSQAVAGYNMVVDCTGLFSVAGALADVCESADIPLVNVTLFHEGRLARVQRQVPGDPSIASRALDRRFVVPPPAEADALSPGFLELGCTAPVNNASPLAVVAAAADAADLAVDFLTGRVARACERYLVFRSMDAPFEHLGTIDYPVEDDT